MSGALFIYRFTNVIKLTLISPTQSLPIRSWTFYTEDVIKIGRATDNHVIVYGSVVSRHHVEIRREQAQWQVFNLGKNGTYYDGHPFDHMIVQEGLIINLGGSGPRIAIHFINGHEVATVQRDHEDLSLADNTSPTTIPDGQ